MTLRHLKIFLTVCDEKTMKKAAEVLHISQPSISQAIQELEKHYNIKLFERIAKRIYLTEIGKTVQSYARYIIDSYNQMEQAIIDTSNQNIIRIGASVTCGTVLLPSIIDELRKNISDVDIRVTIDNSSNIENLINSSMLDIALIEGVVINDDLIINDFCNDELVMVVGKKHHFYHTKKISLNDLNNEAIISREQGSIERNQFDLYLNEHGIKLNYKWSSTNTEAIKQAVINNEGIAIVSKLLISEELKNHALKILNVDDIHITRKIKLIYHKNKYLTYPMLKLIEIIKASNN